MNIPHRLRPVLLLLSTTLLSIGCSRTLSQKDLIPSDQLGSPRGYRIARIITHFHSPYSWDACDKQGIQNGILNVECLNSLRNAMCKNHIDFLFLTDHSNSMAPYEFKDLLLNDPRDLLYKKNGMPIFNKIGTCADGHTPTLMVGFESRLMALGMTQHLSDSPEIRNSKYEGETLELKQELQNTAHAVVAIPHTESRSLELIKKIQPDAIEIYNFHANVDPKIRRHDLKKKPFENLPDLLTYLLDPMNQLDPDFSFLSFLETDPLYFKIWNSLIDSGMSVSGIGGSDSHENTFPQKASDGERLDSHRRISRMLSNHFLVRELTPRAVKGAIKAGQGWVVFEGFGSPLNMDFYATLNSSATPEHIGPGESKTLTPQTTLTVSLPRVLHHFSSQTEWPVVRILLKRVLKDGADEVVAQSENTTLYYNVPTPGAYRAEIYIVPKHLREFLGNMPEKADQEFPWIITNHIYLK